MDIYNKNYKLRKKIITETKNQGIDLNKVHGRNILVGTTRWKWQVVGSGVRATSENGQKIVGEGYKITGFDSNEAFEAAKYNKDSNSSITPRVVSQWISANQQ